MTRQVGSEDHQGKKGGKCGGAANAWCTANEGDKRVEVMHGGDKRGTKGGSGDARWCGDCSKNCLHQEVDTDKTFLVKY